MVARQITRVSAILHSSLILGEARHARRLTLSAREERNPGCWLFQVSLRNDILVNFRKLHQPVPQTSGAPHLNLAKWRRQCRRTAREFADMTTNGHTNSGCLMRQGVRAGPQP